MVYTVRETGDGETEMRDGRVRTRQTRQAVTLGCPIGHPVIDIQIVANQE